MTLKPVIQQRIIRVFAGFALGLGLVYSAFVLLYSWVVEDNIFNRLVANEADYIRAEYANTQQVPTPRVDFVSLYSDWSELPANIAQLRVEDPERIEFELNGGTLHLTEIRLDDQLFILAADVSAFEVSRDYLPTLSVWLVMALLVISLIAVVIGIRVATTTLKPLRRLTEKVQASKQDVIDNTFANEFGQDEVGYLARTLADTLGHLQQVLQRETDFTRDVSHELRTPITVLSNLSDTLAGSAALSPKQQQQFSYAVAEMQQSVQVLLALAREESMHLRELTLLPVLEDCIIHHHELSQHQDFSLTVEVAADIKVSANANLLKILINNLLTNALRYASAAWLNIRVEDDCLIFENESAALRLDAPFASLSKSAHSEGLGQGLNIVKRVCLQFGWQVTLEHENNRFLLRIRLQHTQAE